jgi:alpha-mannosidase
MASAPTEQTLRKFLAMNHLMNRCGLKIALFFAAGTLSVSAFDGKQPQSLEPDNCVFRIGAFDGSSAEFDQGPVATKQGSYVVGRSVAAVDWQGFQPAILSARLANPADNAASSRTIEFQVPDAPAATYRLRVALIFKHASIPVLRVTIDGKSGIFYPVPKLDYQMGDPDASSIPFYSTADVVFAFPGSFLHRGQNTIALQVVEEAAESVPEAGINYDAIELDRAAGLSTGDNPSARIEPTVYFRKAGDGLVERVDVTFRSGGKLDSEDTLSLLLAGKSYQQRIGVSADFGEARVSFEVPEFPPQSVAKALWRSGGTTGDAEQTIGPKKKWTILLVPHIHLDVGFSDYQAKVATIQARIIGEALDVFDRHPDFRFSVDGGWCLEQFLKTRNSSERERVVAAIRSRRLGVPAQYANLLTGLPTAETLIRSLYASANFSREHGTPFDYSNTADVPSYSWSYASVLAAAGITDFVAAAHDHRAPVLMQGRLNEHSPFWWEAPDGQKVLFWYARSYLQMRQLFGLPPVVAAGSETMPVFLQQYEHPDYRASSVIVYGTEEENRDLYEEQAELAGKWNAEWAYPRMEYAGFHDALETIRGQFGSDIPTYRGDGGPYWELGAASDAYYVAMERENEGRGPSAEKLSTLASLVDPRIVVDKPALDAMWRNMMLMDEHTWDSANSVDDPDTSESKEQLTVKDSFAVGAQASVDALLRSSMSDLADSVLAGKDSLIVFNTLNWPRNGLVEFDLRKGQEVCDGASGSVVPLQLVREGNVMNRVRFEAEQVPALGYRVYHFQKAPGTTPGAGSDQAATLESPYYRVDLDAASGAIRSIYDKELQRELVDQENDYRFGQYLYVTDSNPANNGPWTWYRGKLDLQIHPTGHGKILSVARTPYGWEAQMESEAANTPKVTTTIRLFDREKKIELVEDVEKNAVTDKEAVYFAFPFAVRRPQFRYEIQTTAMDPAKDMYPGAGHEWFSAQHWVSVQGEGVSASVLPLDVPLITLGDIDRGQWLDSFGERRATIFSFAMNNYWEDNYLGSQGGHFRFRYAVTSAPSTSESQLSRLGWEEATPLEFDEVTKQDKSPRRPHSLDGVQASFAQIADPAVLLDTWKPAEDGEGTILRLLDLGGATRSVAIRLPTWSILGAWQTDAVERNQRPLPVEGGHELAVTVHPHEIVTIRIATKGSEKGGADAP